MKFFRLKGKLSQNDDAKDAESYGQHAGKYDAKKLLLDTKMNYFKKVLKNRPVLV
jgi:hypothetical protein